MKPVFNSEKFSIIPGVHFEIVKNTFRGDKSDKYVTKRRSYLFCYGREFTISTCDVSSFSFFVIFFGLWAFSVPYVPYSSRFHTFKAKNVLCSWPLDFIDFLWKRKIFKSPPNGHWLDLCKNSSKIETGSKIDPSIPNFISKR